MPRSVRSYPKAETNWDAFFTYASAKATAKVTNAPAATAVEEISNAEPVYHWNSTSRGQAGSGNEHDKRLYDLLFNNQK